jgi:hypothetical protein
MKLLENNFHSSAKRRQSPPYNGKVFIIATLLEETVDIELLGTCFAITSKHILTAYHNLVINSTLRERCIISEIARKVGEKDVLDEKNFEVKYVSGDPINDWAILELTDPSQKFNEFISLCKIDDLPNPTTTTEGLKSFYAPIATYRRNAFYELRIWTDDYANVLQYDGNKILMPGGLVRGSCGAPYINHQNEVVAMHLSSIHEGEELSYTKLKKNRYQYNQKEINQRVDELSDSLTDLSDVHQSIRSGVVLSFIQEIVQFVAKHNLPEAKSISSSIISLLEEHNDSSKDAK